jgi:hypothetical protein
MAEKGDIHIDQAHRGYDVTVDGSGKTWYNPFYMKVGPLLPLPVTRIFTQLFYYFSTRLPRPATLTVNTVTATFRLKSLLTLLAV